DRSRTARWILRIGIGTETAKRVHAQISAECGQFRSISERSGGRGEGCLEHRQRSVIELAAKGGEQRRGPEPAGLHPGTAGRFGILAQPSGTGGKTPPKFCRCALQLRRGTLV